VRPQWIDGSDRFWYRYATAEGRHYWVVDPAGKTKRPLFDRKRLAAELKRLTKRFHGFQYLDLDDLVFTGGGDRIRFGAGEERFEYDLESEELTLVETEEKAPPRPGWQNVSPDGTLCVFARGNELFVMDPADPDAEEVRITSDGVRGLSWGSEWFLADDFDSERRRVDAVWSPDSRKFCILRADLRLVHDLWLVDHLAEPRPALKTFKYPLPGENVPLWELWIFDREGLRMTKVETARWDSQSLTDLFHAGTWWSPDSRTLYFMRRSRDYFSVDVCAVDPVTGESRPVIEERMDIQAYTHPLEQLQGSGELLWWSMRDGWGHYYLYDTGGKLKNQVTRGEFNAERIAAVDAERRELFFIGNAREGGRNPYYEHLYRVGLDGKGLRLLTPEDAHHKVVMSPSRRFFVDNFSRVDAPTRAVLRDAEGGLVLELETADVSKLTEAGWQPPEIFHAKAADGETDLWGVMYKPFDMDPNRKYPVITRGYPGRQSEFIPREFMPVNVETGIAQLGFIIAWFGNRGGCPQRGLEYREFGRYDFRDFCLPDKKAVIEELARRHSFIDIDRVGIVGSSSGGFMATSAMLVYPDFFKVGVAMTSPNDPRMYFKQWVERYQGVERIEEPDGSVRWEADADGNVELAADLKGRLLMIYGAQDDNVHITNLYRMADALIKAGKRFDMFVVPGAGHGLGDYRYLFKLITDYFVQYLLGDSTGAQVLFNMDPDCTGRR
jgi:dipeptidyl aminopeptidase/acylaminoacyl peptidase